MALSKVARWATAADTSAHSSGGMISGSGSSVHGRSAPFGIGVDVVGNAVFLNPLLGKIETPAHFLRRHRVEMSSETVSSADAQHHPPTTFRRSGGDCGGRLRGGCEPFILFTSENRPFPACFCGEPEFLIKTDASLT